MKTGEKRTMKTIENEINSYISDVRKNLVCNRKIKKQTVTDLRNSVFDYAENNNITDINLIYKHFGSPEELAKSFMTENDLKYLKRKIIIRRIILAVVFIILALISFLLIKEVMNQATSDINRYTETIFEGTTRYAIEESSEYF